MSGAVRSTGEATLSLSVSGPDGVTLEIEAVVDTGFSEALAVPQTYVVALGLVFLHTSQMELADAVTAQLHAYEAWVDWHGARVPVQVHAAEGKPLLGMGLLAGSRLTIDVTQGGAVTVEPLPAT
jgi:clan AA aspartic protease